MSNPTGDDSQSAQDEEERQREVLFFNIKAHLEDLFSDRQLAQDGFLLKHVQKNKQGYVSLKLLTCLKKIKALTTNWYMTLAAAEYSDLLEVNDERTKVRRIAPLPKWLLCSPTSKLLLAWNISEDQTREDGAAQGLERPSLSERILQRFSAHGVVTSVWILHPGKELPKELRCYATRHKALGQHLCAVVKFDSLDAVRKAYNVLKAEEEKSNGKGMCVVPLGFQSMHRVGKDESSEEKNKDQPENALSQENPSETSEDSVQEEPSSPATVSDKTPDTRLPQNTLNNSVQKTFEQISTSCKGQSFSGLNERYSRMTWCSGDFDKESSRSPWVMRRKFEAIALNPEAPVHPNVLYLMQRVLRQPFGPDGTTGFQGGGKSLQRIEEDEFKFSPGRSSQR
ncbi:LOW QUALITY PROTEIN: la-related protein 6b [Xiphias gladius]|uniref:LOW QUALITY PROTEIN: la-related protein 6b n=1 Tax=Xiphias gladius TaxID=8245 RepID=UPI001A9A0BB3|nr:LOW QUALITY PROTEIN: la-related protein 6b [Xiphias gladius]